MIVLLGFDVHQCVSPKMGDVRSSLLGKGKKRGSDMEDGKMSQLCLFQCSLTKLNKGPLMKLILSFLRAVAKKHIKISNFAGLVLLLVIC